ncbi:SDR family oxidoreductase [Salinibacterium sp. dk2585]|nr:SDR family oxidoreductase [Salinibacterium sp. dk2585]TXK52951.1 SDR family oxidoreductase [Salinibacterium sp. dk5596]
MATYREPPTAAVSPVSWASSIRRSRVGKLSGRTGLVTGAGQGIGAAIARRLVLDGANVVIFDLNAEPASSLAEELNAIGSEGGAVSVMGSVTDADDIAKAFDVGRSAFGEVDLLVNNAGTSGLSLVAETEEPSWDRIVDVVLKGTFLVSKEFGRRLIAAGGPGAVVNVSSLNWQAPSEGIAAYSAAKAGVVQLTNSLALEWGPHRIRANSIAPGSTETPMLDSILTDRMRHEFLTRTPLARLGNGEDIAMVVSFLLSEEARWVTGAVVPVDGGQHIRLLQSYWNMMNDA